MPYHAYRELLEDDPDYYTMPPKAENPNHDIPRVSFRVTIFRLHNIDTKYLTLDTKVGIVMYWNDHRLKDFDGFLLPGNLWGPEMYLMNGITCEAEYEQFVLVDRQEGRLKRIVNYTSTIVAPMLLKCFPFDVQTVGPHFLTISHWRSLDLAHMGSSPGQQLYTIAPVTKENEGVFFRFFSTEITEFSLLASEACLEEPPGDSAGFKVTHLKINFTIKRSSRYYVLKAIVPIYLLTSISFLTFATEVEEGLSTRLGLAFTMLLAAIALQTVVADTVPRIDFLTVIDWVASISILYLCLIAVVATIIDKVVIYGRLSSIQVSHMNLWLGITLFLTYSLLCCFFLIPAMKGQKKKEREFENSEMVKSGATRARKSSFKLNLSKKKSVFDSVHPVINSNVNTTDGEQKKV